MKTNDLDLRNAALSEFLSELATMWSLGRALLEHERAGASPVEQRYTEREMLSLCLIEQFEGLVTATTFCKVFGLHPSQVSKIVGGLVSRELLKKSTASISKKSGRGSPFELTPKGREAVAEIKLIIGAGFEYLYKDFKLEEIQILCELTRKTHAAAKKRFTRSVFQIVDPNFLKKETEV